MTNPSDNTTSVWQLPIKIRAKKKNDNNENGNKRKMKVRDAAIICALCDLLSIVYIGVEFFIFLTNGNLYYILHGTLVPILMQIPFCVFLILILRTIAIYKE